MLAPENVDREALMEYARDAADFATSYQLPSLDFAVNHYGQADVAMFDFTSMYAAENACRVLERRGHKLLQGLVGDSLLEVILNLILYESFCISPLYAFKIVCILSYLCCCFSYHIFK